ncbi:hypothetical protein GO613_13895 [Azoarcus communis]|uniref:DUF5455 family protein n=1 Tax=Parazoarcus communis TaxID=41977 RepID=UPI00145940F0|nr:DUF5455 family protein [Parazoarcus communis]NMG49196.1 hypothetical protein [Parazoarcus communis]
MQLVAMFFASVFGSIFAVLVRHFSHKAAMAVVITALVLTVTTVFYITVKMLVNGVTQLITNDYLLMAFWALWPDNADICISAIFASDVAAFVYRYKLRVIAMISSAS